MNEILNTNNSIILLAITVITVILKYHQTIKNIFNVNENIYKKLKSNLENEHLDEDIKELLRSKIKRLSFTMATGVRTLENNLEDVKELYKKVHKMKVGFKVEKSIFNLISFDNKSINVKKVWNLSTIYLLIYYGIMTFFLLVFLSFLVYIYFISKETAPVWYWIVSCLVFGIVAGIFYFKIDETKKTNRLRIKINNKNINEI